MKNKFNIAHRLLFYSAVLIALNAVLAGSADAQYSWTNTTNTNNEWGSFTNWSPGGGPPGPVDSAHFNSSETYDVSVWGDYGVKYLDFTDGNVTLSSQNNSLYQITVFAPNSGQPSDLSISGPTTELTVRGLRLRSNGGAQITDGATLTLDGSHAAGAMFSVADTLKVGGNMNVLAGGVVSNTIGTIGDSAFATSTATVSGVGSQWNNSSILNVGSLGNGTLNVTAGGVVSSGTSRIAFNSGGTSIAMVSGAGSQWNNGHFDVGSNGNGTLNVESGGIVSTYIGHIARNTGSTGVATVTGAGSQWNTSFDLHIGNQGNGTLNVAAGGIVSNSAGYIGFDSGSTGLVVVSDTGSQWNNSSTMSVGNSGNGTLNIESGGVVSNSIGYIGRNAGLNGSATVTGTNSQWNNSSALYAGYSGNGTMNVESGGVVSNSTGYIGRNSGSTGLVTVTGTGSQWNNSSASYIGYSGTGTLNVESGGVVSNSVSYVGRNGISVGSVGVTGTGSQWNNSSSLHVGGSGNGTLSIRTGGVVTDSIGFIGWGAGSTGLATVNGSGSQWNHSGDVNIGYTGNGTLNISSGGVMSNGLDGYIGTNPGAIGAVTVVGTGSQWNNANHLFVGGYDTGAGGTGTLNINNGGLVSVGGTTRIWSTGAVNLTGGRFEFGETTLPEFSTINAVSGSMGGNLNHSGYTNANTLTPLQNPNVDLTDVTLTNSGTLYGNASLGNALINSTSGELLTVAGELIRFAGNGNINAGEINNFGGTVLFARDVTNGSTGFITGRGVFGADGGWTNEGVMAFSAGITDVLGDVNLAGGGQVVTSGGATTTFYDDVVHNGSEIRTAAGSNTVFFGSVSGASGFTGLGTVFMEGDLRPGNSPGILSFEGDLVLGAGAEAIIELGGYFPGEFDQLDIAGDFFLDGDLSVELIDGFQLMAGQQFLVADIEGGLFGQFNGLGENEWVGSLGGRDLFITYAAGNGNDIALFTSSVPEPGTVGLVGVLSVVMILRRRRPNTNSGQATLER